MDFLKKHYEKIILSVVLVGLAGVAAWLPAKVRSDRDLLKRMEITFEVNPKPLPPLTNMTVLNDHLQSLKNPQSLDFGLPHNLLNPVKWMKMPSGEIIKITSETDVGLGALKLTRIIPLRFIVSLERVAEGSGGYHMGITREAATNPRDATKKQFYAALNQKLGTNNIFLREVKGAPEDPSELVFEFSDSKERFSVSREKPYERVDAYAADLSYPPEKKTFNAKRRGDRLPFNNETNNIVAISSSNVVVSAPNGKNQTIPLESATVK